MDLRVMQHTDDRAELVAARLVIGFFAIAVIGVLVGRLVTGPLYAWVTGNLDDPIRTFSLSHATSAGVRAARDVSVFGSAAATGLLAVAVGVIWSVRVRNARPALLLTSAFVGAFAIAFVVKYLVHRAPASGPIGLRTPGTFPSGHTLFAVAVYGAIAVLVLRTDGPRTLRVAVAVPLLALPIAIAAARLYLLDHFFTDAFASLVLGAMWVAVTVVVLDRERSPSG
jgi:undecaprenyl-diphosphatase